MATLSNKYDVLLVGAGLFNAVLAYRLQKMGLSVLVVEKRKGEDAIGGNCSTRNMGGIHVHTYGAHIFHTSDESVWNFANKFAKFTPFVNSPVAMVTNCHNKVPRRANTSEKVVLPNKYYAYNLPFNMNTFARLFNETDPCLVKYLIDTETAPYVKPEYANLEEKALSMVGPTIYETFIKHYTEKQWGRPCTELSPDIITRIPLRFTYDNNYFTDTYQGIPVGGYSQWIKNMFGDAHIITGVNFLEHTEDLIPIASHVFYSGRVDDFFKRKYGELEYRSLSFDIRFEPTDNYQGVAVANWPGPEVPYTRTIEHRHFMSAEEQKSIEHKGTYITTEYPSKMYTYSEPFYSVNDAKNNALYAKYLAECPDYMTFVGRLGMYKYNDMDDTILQALNIDLSRFAKKL